MADALGCPRIFADTKDYVPLKDDVIINWGTGYRPQWNYKVPLILNKVKAVANAVNKINSFYAFMENKVSTPVWTQYKEWAERWIANGEIALSRTTAEGHDGSGLIVCKTKAELVPAPLYTKYVPISQEFRVYVFKDKLIDVLEKKRKVIADADPLIRCESRGWVFCQNPKWWPEEAVAEAIKAVAALGLDFGGVDVVYNEERKKCYVLEVNTASDVYGYTPAKYAKAMVDYIGTL
jgi:hypothetical protein